MNPSSQAVPGRVLVTVAHANALTFDADVLVLKYAQALHGVDRAAVSQLRERQVRIDLPAEGSEKVVNTGGILTPRQVLFVGVSTLRYFDYRAIRDFARRAFVRLDRDAPDIRSAALTVHGAGYGLDESEAFASELAGVFEGLYSGTLSRKLETITFVEVERTRAQRLTSWLSKWLPNGFIDIDPRNRGADERYASLQKAGHDSAAKPHVFVAMPFATEMDDTFHYGIQNASNAAGYLCERADLSSFTGADLSNANPNVYLEVGYAWGCKVPTVLLARADTELKFDVRTQRCIVYHSIRELETKLSAELSQLRAKGG